MTKPGPDFSDLGYSSSMGPQLRQLVEKQLSNDLENYGIKNRELKFDWSDSCIEGHVTKYLNGSVENYSGICVFSSQNELLAEGWMEFIHQDNFFLAYWDLVTTWNADKKLSEKKDIGIPKHIWNLIPNNIKPKLNYQ
jgi:hypothetical protein